MPSVTDFPFQNWPTSVSRFMKFHLKGKKSHFSGNDFLAVFQHVIMLFVVFYATVSRVNIKQRVHI